jgi:hypothetical protein
MPKGLFSVKKKHFKKYRTKDFCVHRNLGNIYFDHFSPNFFINASDIIAHQGGAIGDNAALLAL